jgi:sugar phosphate isomerase/epimerase
MLDVQQTDTGAEVKVMQDRTFRLGYAIRNDDDYALTKLGAALDEAAGMNVDVVELPLYAIDVIADGRIWADRLAKLKAVTAGRPFGYTIHGPLRLNLLLDDDQIGMQRDVLKATLEVAAELGGIHYVAHSGLEPADDGVDIESRYARQREILAEMGDFAAQHGIVIAVENLFGRNGRATLPSHLAREIAAIAHPAVAACLDFSHAYLLTAARGVDFLDEAAALAPYAQHLHVHDSFGKLGGPSFSYRSEQLAHGIGDLHLPIGRGSIPWDALLERCRFPANPIFIHELAPHYWPELAEAVAGTREFAGKAQIGRH